MVARRIQGNIYRFGLASPDHFADWRNPTVAELNANPDNDPSGTIFHLTCALDVDGTVFNLADPDMDDSTSFCEEATDSSPISRNVDITYEIFRATEEGRLDDPTKYNTAHLAFTLLAWRGVEYYAFMSVGRGPDEDFEVGDRVSLALVATDWALDNGATAEVMRMTQEFAPRGRVAWNQKLEA